MKPTLVRELVIDALFESLFNYSQWVSSDRLRHLTGWKERKPNFAEG